MRDACVMKPVAVVFWCVCVLLVFVCRCCGFFCCCFFVWGVGGGEVDRQESFANAEWFPVNYTRTFKDIRYMGMT